MDIDYRAAAERRVRAERPSGLASVEWWIARRTEPCTLQESSGTVDLYDDYLSEVLGEYGMPLGRNTWSQAMAGLGYPSTVVADPSPAPGQRGRRRRVRRGIRLKEQS